MTPPSAMEPETRMSTSDDSPLEFPCRFPVKAMGRAESDFADLVLAIVQDHAPEANKSGTKVAESRNGTYVSVTVTVTATSREQLDAIYAALQSHERVLASL